MDGNNEEVLKEMKEIYSFLSNWLITHIMKTDREYTPFFDKVRKKASSGGFMNLFT